MASEEVLKLFKIEKLKEEQSAILKCILEGRDCMAVLPTGFGKSLPYQMAVVQQKMKGEDAKKIVVCCPLTALMKDQVDKLSVIPNVRAIYRDGSKETDCMIREGAFDYLFGAPELLVGDSSFREQLHKFSVSTIVVDEFHTIASWGEKDEEDRQAFRRWFSYLGELRSIFPEASLLALSATCTRKISKRVKKVLNFRDNTLEIHMSPDKPNIKVVTKKIANSVDQGMAWMVDALDSIPKTVIYCNSIKDVSKLYAYLTSEVPKSVNYCEMFHSETPKAKKEKILDDMCCEEGLLKIIIATSALGMGIDVPKTNNVILYGIPQQMVEIIQEIGRVGRDGSPALAVLLYNSYHLRKVDKEVKDLFVTKTCRRMAILKPFLGEEEIHEETKEPYHTCCDLCMSKCNCNNCSRDSFALEKMLKDTLSDSDSDATEICDDYDEFEAFMSSDFEFE
uniref:DNA 3'-5' helicase n=1 Tax=Crassostrea virginica TaxID=6565 RepID=A0A8B8AQR2_CRAVI|nr:uncharacterized protein LOC111103492 [Crassostrea virginica]